MQARQLVRCINMLGFAWQRKFRNNAEKIRMAAAGALDDRHKSRSEPGIRYDIGYVEYIRRIGFVAYAPLVPARYRED